MSVARVRCGHIDTVWCMMRVILQCHSHIFLQVGKAKRKRDDPDGAALLPMEEMLNALAIDKVTPIQAPSSDDQVHLLLQVW